MEIFHDDLFVTREESEDHQNQLNDFFFFCGKLVDVLKCPEIVLHIFHSGLRLTGLHPKNPRASVANSTVLGRAIN